MPRKGAISKRQVMPDPIFNDVVVARFMNKLMYGGKKSVAEKIFYSSRDVIAQKTGKDALKVFNQAMENVMPLVEVRPRRVGGATYQVPVEVRPDRRLSLAMRWLVGNARKRAGKTMMDKLSAELLDASV